MSKDKNKDEQTNRSASTDEPISISLGDSHKGPEESIVGTIFVNREKRIKAVISSVNELINLSSFDEDLEINDFSRQLRYEGITDDISHVLRYRDKVKKEVAGKNGRWYMIELRPHITEDDNDGVVITFVDVTELKEAEEELAEKVDTIKELQRQIIKNDVSERWKIGQFLHDDLGQTLVTAEIMLKEMKNKLTNAEKDVEKDITQLEDLLSQSMTDVRDLSHEIVPVDIEEKGIKHAFNNFARQLEKIHDIHCELEYDNTVDRIDNVEIATHLYRIAHEATKNADMHGNAKSVKICLRSDNEYLYLKIEDDGTGFSDSAREEGGGMGINIMRHRMELIGGTFEIENTSDIGDTGATVFCKVPLEEF